MELENQKKLVKILEQSGAEETEKKRILQEVLHLAAERTIRAAVTELDNGDTEKLEKMLEDNEPAQGRQF